MIRVLLADDHTIVREGVRLCLEAMGDIEVVAEAEDGQVAVQLANQLRPDVAVVDLTMPRLNGVEAIRQKRARRAAAAGPAEAVAAKPSTAGDGETGTRPRRGARARRR